MMDNRDKTKELCALADSYPAAAALIEKETKRLLSVDAIKSWTCDPSAKRAAPVRIGQSRFWKNN
jgi:hypothetical protein